MSEETFYLNRSDAQRTLDLLSGKPPRSLKLGHRPGILFTPARAFGLISGASGGLLGAGYAVLLNTDVLEPVANLSIEHVGDGQPILLRREQSTNVLTSDARPCWPDLCDRPIESIRIKRTISERTISYVTEDRGDGVGTYVEEYSEPTNTVEYDETLSVGHSVFDVPYRRWSDGCTNVVSRNVILYGSCVVAHSQPLRDFTVTIQLPAAPTTETIAAIFDPVDCSPVATRLYVQVSIDGAFNESQSFHWSDERFIKTPMAWRYRCTQFTVNLAPVSCPTASQIESAFQSAIIALAGTHPELAGVIVIRCNARPQWLVWKPTIDASTGRISAATNPISRSLPTCFMHRGIHYRWRSPATSHTLVESIRPAGPSCAAPQRDIANRAKPGAFACLRRNSCGGRRSPFKAREAYPNYQCNHRHRHAMERAGAIAQQRLRIARQQCRPAVRARGTSAGGLDSPELGRRPGGWRVGTRRARLLSALAGARSVSIPDRVVDRPTVLGLLVTVGVGAARPQYDMARGTDGLSPPAPAQLERGRLVVRLPSFRRSL